MYDNTCKYLAENFSSDFATWLLGQPISLTKIETSELSAEPIRADSVIFLESSAIIMHLEFQTKPDENMAFRMANYWLRLYSKYPNKQIYQAVIYLKPSNSALVYQNSFNSKQLNHEFNVIRLWEQPTDIFQKHLGLMPLAVLTNTSNPEETLRQITAQIAKIKDRQLQSNVAASTAIISGITLSKEVIQRLLRSELMKESVIYQEILLEGLLEGEARGIAKGEARGIARGKARGIAKGKSETANQIALNMLRSDVPLELVAQYTGLSLKRLQALQKLNTQQSTPNNK